ncbi:kinesin-like protein KIF18B isoform X1 [Pipistrellus kuhlii]|uniref:Kinesin-like protein n=2 Tax=Pipistrellus kuhlii TaxID=59472 RepID=A0A7J7U870_PIPKU|nr:kinesin-like protein KIF18B isoform X1 [Pipistrellus kuhlii]XP_045442144.1 kinesin-like protein KIF18B isoform X1 [Pipistrellus kuhlii]KAF6309044.1 kinesin family member 18B [Pipistrellus kuhlii]
MVMAVEDSAVQVVVRVRPPTPRELESQRRPVIQVVDERVLVFDPEEPDGGLVGLKWGGAHEGPRKKGKDLTFVFDRVLGEAAGQQDVFQHTTRRLLDSFLQGFNCSVFAYGATGAGKTHTMLGREGDPGIMYLTTMELYRRLEARQEEKRFEVLISYQEVYNEQIHDLLEPKGPLAIREDPDKGVVVQGLSFHQPTSAEQLLEMLTRGNRNRTQHPTDANATSSRSHAIFQIFVKQQDRVPGLTQALQVAKMSLIDLAGSERASSTHAKGERLREGANINRSLLALINVLNALADAKGRKTHVPYRDSKLTRLLKDSIGGNCRTVMIAAISPSGLTYEDTYNTLKYADRAKEIKLSLKSNVVSLDCHISQYATVCQQLQAEVASLREKLRMYEAGAQAPQQDLPRPPTSGPPQPPLCSSSPPSPLPSQPCTPKLHPGSAVLQEESLGAGAQGERVREGDSSDQEQPSEDKDRGPAKEVPVLVSAQSPRQSLLESPGLALEAKQVEDHLSPQDLEKGCSRQLVLKVLSLARRQYSLLQAANLLTPDMIAEFKTLQQLVREEEPGPGAEASRTPGPAREAPPAQEPCSESKLPGYSGPVTRTMARQLSGLVPSVGVPPEPDGTSAQASLPSVEKKRRKLSRSEQDSQQAPRLGTKRQHQSFLPCLRRGSLPETQPSLGPTPPKKGRGSSPCHSPRFCPATVVKSRVPLGPSALQNCSTPLALPARNLNITFDLSEETPSKLGFHERAGWENVPPHRLDQPFVPSGPAPLFTTKGPKPASSFPEASARKKRRVVSSAISRRSRIARLPSSTLKRLAESLTAPGD